MTRGRGASQCIKEGRSDSSARAPRVEPSAASDASISVMNATAGRDDLPLPSDRATTTTGGGVLSARVSGEELAAFDVLIKTLGLRSSSDALPVMV